MSGPRIARLTVYPVKSLDGKSVQSTRFTARGGLVDDRIYALVDDSGAYVNGKSEPQVHRIRSGFDLDQHRLCVRDVAEPPGEAESFSLPEDSSAAEDWFQAYLGYPVTLRREPMGGFPDDTTNPGPTVISTASIETLASWYDDVTTDEMRRRLRANVEIEGVPSFWEDRLFAHHGEVVRFRLGDAELDGVNPCRRCIVPARDPDTGEETPRFRERFIEQRRATKPEWTDSNRFDSDYRVMVNTRVPDQGATLNVGDPVAILDTRPEEGA